MRNSYFDAELHFVQTEYGKQPPFSGFLPAFAGPWGIPTWCNYNNRGQAICSFGVQDKNHAILEFIAASTAYRCTALTGFRTFLKQGGIVVEPFADSMGTMILEPNALRLTWKNEQTSVEVVYFTLPNERMAGLCRRLRIQNLSSAETVLELLDGLATIVPYGVCDEKLKQEPNLSTAWMRVEKAEEHLPCFGIRASMEDSTRVSEISGRNFRLAFAEDERLLPVRLGHFPAASRCLRVSTAFRAAAPAVGQRKLSALLHDGVARDTPGQRHCRAVGVLRSGKRRAGTARLLRKGSK